MLQRRDIIWERKLALAKLPTANAQKKRPINNDETFIQDKKLQCYLFASAGIGASPTYFPPLYSLIWISIPLLS